MAKLAKINRRALFWICLALWAAAVLAFSAQLARQRVFLLDYNPVDGDFQSYNAFRRVLAGQAPYAHFANYVGMAPIWLNLPLLAAAGGSFSASLFVTNFTCNVLFSLCVLAVFWLCTQNAPVSFLASATVSKLVASGLVAFATGPAGQYFTTLYQNLYAPGNSMRIARVFWPFLLVLGYLVFDKLYTRKKGEHYPLAAGPTRPVFCAVAGALAGAGVTWSNDFGLAVIAALALMMTVLLAAARPGWKTALRNLALFFAAAALAALLSATIVTGGQPGAWWRHTTGVGQYQYFYFNGASGRALLPYIFTNGRLLLFTAPYAALLLWCLWRLRRGRLSTNALLAAFLAAAIAAGSYAYVLAGSGYNFTEALEGFFWLALAGLAVRGLLWLLRRWQRQAALAATALLCAASLVVCTAACLDAAALSTRPREGAYFEDLGGYTNYTKALREGAEYTLNKDVFSVYATGLEVVKHQFQPSGYDYIIHALGTGARADYLRTFAEGDYAFVQTMDLPLESWLCLENWDFYRQVAAGYRRAVRTEYSWLWEKAEESQAITNIEATVTLRPEGDNWVVEVQGPPGANFTADVQVAYQSSFKSGGGAVLSLGRRCVAVSIDDPVTYATQRVWGYFPAEATALALPVPVRDGVGSAVLVPCDAKYVQLDVTSATITTLLPDLRTEDRPQP